MLFYVKFLICVKKKIGLTKNKKFKRKILLIKEMDIITQMWDC